MEGLTLSLALSFLFVLIPGYAGLWAEGKLEEARQRFYPALYKGVINFGLVTLVVLIFFPEKYRTLLNILSGELAELTWLRLIGWMAVFYLPAVFTGLANHLGYLRFVFSLKASRAWWRFLMGDAVIEVSPREDMFWDMFLCYRAIGKRPIISVTLDGGENASGSIDGEVLKVSCGIKPGILLADMDFPQTVTWVSLHHVKAVTFKNPGVPSDCGLIDSKVRELLNLMHPGYGDEVEEKYTKARDL
ncbi:hypothetical protein MHFGQ_17080 [Moorella humiferrea]|jgi:hypothetical protein|uniref:Uncharacterized protein n=2 Tax=Neomoorella humiferrea TaxID=676965 RepID=A0A2T0ARE1_9FIRM|nr:hypothetical protein MOHU_15700 [Moorella humiferrea]